MRRNVCWAGGRRRKRWSRPGVLDMTWPDLPLTIYETSSPSFTLKREALILLIASNHDSPHPYSPFPTWSIYICNSQWPIFTFFSKFKERKKKKKENTLYSPLISPFLTRLFLIEFLGVLARSPILCLSGGSWQAFHHKRALSSLAHTPLFGAGASPRNQTLIEFKKTEGFQ